MTLTDDVREPENSAEQELLDLHRFLHPEEHEDYWKTQSEADWPYGWEGPGTIYEWRGGDTLVAVAESITSRLQALELLP